MCSSDLRRVEAGCQDQQSKECSLGCFLLFPSLLIPSLLDPCPVFSCVISKMHVLKELIKDLSREDHQTRWGWNCRVAADPRGMQEVARVPSSAPWKRPSTAGSSNCDPGGRGWRFTLGGLTGVVKINGQLGIDLKSRMADTAYG